jgi:hypothetical protein
VDVEQHCVAHGGPSGGSGTGGLALLSYANLRGISWDSFDHREHPFAATHPRTLSA